MGVERRTRGVVAAAVAACLATAAPPAFSWGANGHRIVGELAEKNLGADARESIAGFLGDISLAQIATWPDFVKSEPKWRFAGPWHYVTVEDDGELMSVLRRAGESAEPDNALEAVELLEKVLAGDADARSQFEEQLAAEGVEPLMGSTDATALAFFLHIAGDLHQPLHVGRGGDAGGNAITVNWFGEPRKLHSVWDSGMIDRELLSFTEWVRFLEEEFDGRAADWRDARPVEWALESRALRLQVYDIWRKTDRANFLPDLGYRYSYDHLGTVKRRLFQAGVRVAAMLDAIYGSAPSSAR